MSDHITAINTLAAAYDRYGWDDLALAGYLVALDDLPITLVQQAVAHALRSHAGKMPTPAELRGYAYRLHAPQPPGPDEAWGIARAAMARHGRDHQPEFDHPAIAATIRYIGGWYRLCLSEDETGDRIAFVRTYRDVVQRMEHDELVAPGFQALDPLGRLEVNGNGRRALPAVTRRTDDL